MKLDTILAQLRTTLEDAARDRPTRIDPNFIEDVVWFLELLRKREGYDVERPVRKPRPESKENIWRGAFEDFHESFKRGFNFEEIERRMREEMNRRAYSEFRSYSYDPFRGTSSQRGEPPPRTESKRERPWHEVLGVRPDSTKPQRIKAYRSLAMKCHPDRPGGSNEKMQELNQAKKEAGII